MSENQKSVWSKFLTRRQYDNLISKCEIWIAANWKGLEQNWSLSGVLVSGLTREQYIFLDERFK